MLKEKNVPSHYTLNRGNDVYTIANGNYVCTFCESYCNQKNIGYVCIRCINTVPTYIPLEQIMRYLKIKNV